MRVRACVRACARACACVRARVFCVLYDDEFQKGTRIVSSSALIVGTWGAQNCVASHEARVYEDTSDSENLPPLEADQRIGVSH